MDAALAPLFLQHSVQKLRQMTGHLQDCLHRLSDQQIWQRGGPHENAIGNLILHLCGNVRQWIGHTVAGQPDVRVRDAEFAAQEGQTSAALRELLRQTVDEAVAVIEAVTPDKLGSAVTTQHGTLSTLEAIYQVVGHFQQHTGQVILLTKQWTGVGVELYRPRTPEQCDSLAEVREEIDRLDRQLIARLAERRQYVLAAARFKADETQIAAPARVQAMLQARRRWAQDQDLSPDLVEALFRELVAHFTHEEKIHWQQRT